MLRHFACVISALFLFCSTKASADEEAKLKGIRLDSGYLYDTLYQRLGVTDARSAANLVVKDAVYQGANTIFVLAYNSVYGALYPTTYPDTVVEQGFGKQNLVGELIQSAHAAGIRVVAWMPINDFKHAWTNHPDWRSKKRDGTDYRPGGAYLLSVLHDSFRAWYQGLVQDLISRNPGIDGIEAGEGMIDYNWNRAADYNAVANQKFKNAYPSATLGDATWRKFRAKGLTDLHGLMSTVAHQNGKAAYVVQTWTARNDSQGTLMTSAEISNGCGFDFDGIMNLPAPSRPDFMIAEIMWQQWRAQYNNPVFTPQWTAFAAQSFVTRVAGRVIPIAHIEMSPFGSVNPTNQDFEVSLRHALQNSAGTDYYDYNLMRQRNAMDNARNAFAVETLDKSPF